MLAAKKWSELSKVIPQICAKSPGHLVSALSSGSPDLVWNESCSKTGNSIWLVVRAWNPSQRIHRKSRLYIGGLGGTCEKMMTALFFSLRHLQTTLKIYTTTFQGAEVVLQHNEEHMQQLCSRAPGWIYNCYFKEHTAEHCNYYGYIHARQKNWKS